jgi:GntR family transcriptional regulator, rspAB operon transcriptional repressor
MLQIIPIDRRRSAVMQIHTQLRDWIVTGRSKPGELMSEPKLAERFGLSRTPIREAIKKLEEEGLLDIFPQVGSVVAPINVDVVRDSQFIRETLECRTIELAVAAATARDIARLRRLIKEQRGLVERSDREGFFRSDDRFHEALMQMSGRRSAWRIVMTTKAQLDRVRYLSLEDNDWLAMVFGEHCGIVEAVASRDAARAVSAMQAHLRTVLAAIERMVLAHPEYFTASTAQVGPSVRAS